MLVGFVGCIVPVIPGPILAVLALIGLSLAGGWELVAPWVMIFVAVAAIAAQLLDNLLPARSAARAGAGKGGIWGSVIGMLVGSVFFPPFGVFVGAFAGALLGELLFHPDNKSPFASALAVFRGTIGAIVLKLAVTGVAAVIFVQAAIRLFRSVVL